MIKKLAIFGNIAKEKVIAFTKEILSWCNEQKIEVFLEESLLKKLDIDSNYPIFNNTLSNDIDIILSLGGDGFLLNAAKMIYPSQTPILHINMGQLGFTSEIDPENVFSYLAELSNREIPIQTRNMLEVKVLRDNRVILEDVGLNDVVIQKDTHSRIVLLEMKIEKEAVANFYGDGLIISTPTGSTAYNLGAGGPILYPTLSCFVITPICPHNLAQRSIILPNDLSIEVIHRKRKSLESIVAIVDGHSWTKIDEGDRIIIKKSKFPINLVFEDNMHYFKNLKEKLHWGGLLNV